MTSTATPAATTVGTYLRDLPPDRRVAMARVCSMIRRSARGVRESMRYGLAFYELDGPLFALESGRRHMSLYVAEQDVVIKHKESLPGVNTARSFVKFSDLNRLPLDIVEKIVRDSVAARRTRAQAGLLPTQAELLKLWAIKEEAAQVPVPAPKLASAKPAGSKTAAGTADAPAKNGVPKGVSGGPAAGKAAAKVAPTLRVPGKSVIKATVKTPIKSSSKSATKTVAKAAAKSALAPTAGKKPASAAKR